MSKDKNLVKAGIASAAVHGFVVALGCLNIFEPQIDSEMFLNIELAGAAEMQRALEDYKNQPEDPQPKPEEIHQKEPEMKSQEVLEDRLLKDSNVVESQPELACEPESEMDESKEIGEALPSELKNEEALRLEKEKLEKVEKEKREKLRKEKERKRRLEEKRKKEKKKKEAERRRRKRLEAIKKLEKKKKARKQRLAKIANVVKENDEVKKKTNDPFSNMLKNEKDTWNQSSKGSGFGNGNGLGSYGDGMGFVNSDAAIVSSQIIPHWVVAGGVKNAETLIIRVRIKMKDNGEIPPSSIEILDKDRYNSDNVFRSAADSAKRAILKASPLKIPTEKRHLFKDFEISFNTDKALGVRK